MGSFTAASAADQFLVAEKIGSSSARAEKPQKNPRGRYLFFGLKKTPTSIWT